MEKIQLQIVLFFLNDYSGNFEFFSLAIKQKFQNSLSTLQLPLPENIPSEVPRLTIQYQDFVINVAKNRYEIIISKQTGIDELITNFVSLDLKQFGIAIKRVGVIQTYFKASTMEEFKTVLTANEMLNGISELAIRFNCPTSLNGFRCNNLESVEFGQAQKVNANGQPIIEQGVIIQRDVNTPTDNVIAIPNETICPIINNFIGYMDSNKSILLQQE